MQTLPDIKKSVVLDAPIEKVWKTVSSAEGIGTWFMENDFKPVEGHEFHIQSPFGPSPCKVLKIEEPNYLSFSWDTDGWFVEFFLKEVEGKTEFTLIHGGWKEADEKVTKAGMESSAVRDRMNGGWEDIINVRLRKAVEA